MDHQIITKSQEQKNLGIARLKDKNRAQAGKHFQDALILLDDIQSPGARRKELGVLAASMQDLGFHDLALLGATDAIALDQQLNDSCHHAEDLLTVGNAHMSLGNTTKAKQAYETTLKLALANQDYDYAASAQTNLAVITANSGEMAKATSMLKDSLDYLKKKSHPHTEVVTRMTLIQTLDVLDKEPDLIVEQGRVLLDKFIGKIRKDQWQVIEPALKRGIERHLKNHPPANRAAWFAEKFPAFSK